MSRIYIYHLLFKKHCYQFLLSNYGKHLMILLCAEFLFSFRIMCVVDRYMLRVPLMLQFSLLRRYLSFPSLASSIFRFFFLFSYSSPSFSSMSVSLRREALGIFFLCNRDQNNVVLDPNCLIFDISTPPAPFSLCFNSKKKKH